jgi:hypothetical protein
VLDKYDPLLFYCPEDLETFCLVNPTRFAERVLNEQNLDLLFVKKEGENEPE